MLEPITEMFHKTTLGVLHLGALVCELNMELEFLRRKSHKTICTGTCMCNEIFYLQSWKISVSNLLYIYTTNKNVSFMLRQNVTMMKDGECLCVFGYIEQGMFLQQRARVHSISQAK